MTPDFTPATQTASSSATRVDEKHFQYVTFTVGDSTYGVDIKLVREIKQWSQTTTLPHQPSFTRGVLNLRGTIVPVHDLRARFGGALTEVIEDHVVVIVWIGSKTVGVLVDTVSDIISVAESEIRPVPESGQFRDAAVVDGLATIQGTMVALLDLNPLFPASDDGMM